MLSNVPVIVLANVFSFWDDLFKLVISPIPVSSLHRPFSLEVPQASCSGLGTRTRASSRRDRRSNTRGPPSSRSRGDQRPPSLSHGRDPRPPRAFHGGR